jgi:hypothetical protein
VHPPRRAAPFIAVVLAVGCLPLLYGDEDAARDVAATNLLWLAVGVVLMLLIASVRAQRLRLRTGERSAVNLEKAGKHQVVFQHAASAPPADAREPPLVDGIHVTRPIVVDAFAPGAPSRLCARRYPIPYR